MSQLWLHSADCLYDCRLDVEHDFCRIEAHLIDVFERKSQTSFVSEIILFTTFVLDVVACRLVDCVISQMHVQVV